MGLFSAVDVLEPMLPKSNLSLSLSLFLIFFSCAYPTYSLQVCRVTVSPDHTEWNKQ